MIDDLDRKVLGLLQADATLTNNQLAEAINVSVSQAGRRKHRLEQEGYIKGYRAHLDPLRLGLSIEAFVEVSLSWHAADAAQAFHAALTDRPEIVGAWTLTGQADYLLHVFCRDLAGLNVLVHDFLLRQEMVSKVESKIVMQPVLSDGVLPLR